MVVNICCRCSRNTPRVLSAKGIVKAEKCIVKVLGVEMLSKNNNNKKEAVWLADEVDGNRFVHTSLILANTRQFYSNDVSLALSCYAAVVQSQQVLFVTVYSMYLMS